MIKNNKIISTVLSLFASSLFFVAVPTTANAGDCSASDPCLTYAVLDSSNMVINTIICQPSVCGSGTFGGNKVVPQVAATPEGQNQGGIFNPPGSGREVSYSDGTFTMNNNPVVNKTDIVVSSKVDTATSVINTETSTISVSISEGNKTTFSYEDTIGKTVGQIDFTTLPLADNVSATVSASEVTTTYTKTESTTFEGRKTEQEISSILLQRNLTLLQSKINRLLLLLDEWVKK